MPPAAASLPLATAGASARRRRQSGQAIVYLVAMLPIIFLSVLVVYNTATAAREKMKLQNTADAATYSANVLTARTLNYLAYTNRAMAANEASIATLASVQTSMAMLITSAANIQEGLVVAEAMKGIRNLERSRIPIVGPIFFLQYLGNLFKAQRLQRTADRIAGFVEPSAKPLQIGADILRAFNQGISASQAVMLLGTTAQLPQLVKDVVNSNDPDASVPATETAIFVIKFVADVGTYLKTYHQSGSLGFDDEEFNEVLRFAHAAQATRDDWTKNRRFLPNVLGWVASGMSGALQGMVSSSPNSPPGFSDITGDMMGGLLEWKGGTELVATEGIVGDETGRIRWQSADSIEIKLPIGVLYTDLIGGWDDIVRGRFGLGAGAAAAGGPNYMKSWEGQRLTLRSYAREGRTYGGLNGEVGDTAYMERESFERAARDRNGELLLAPMAVLVFNAKLHYSPRTDIGLVTKSWAMPRFTEIKDHPPMVANESDNWLKENGFKRRQPAQVGQEHRQGPGLHARRAKGRRQGAHRRGRRLRQLGGRRQGGFARQLPGPRDQGAVDLAGLLPPAAGPLGAPRQRGGRSLDGRQIQRGLRRRLHRAPQPLQPLLARAQRGALAVGARHRHGRRGGRRLGRRRQRQLMKDARA
jgi:hypothetical protein